MIKNNKLSLFLSGLAIALIVLLLLSFKGYILSSKATAAGQSNSEAIEEVYNYIDSLEGFTDAQREVLNSVIKEYMTSRSVVTENDLALVYRLIDEKYKSNRDHLEEIKVALEAKLNATSSTDSAHYSQLNQLIKELDSWLSTNDSTDQTYRTSFKQALSDLHAYSDKADDDLSKLIEELTNNTSDKDAVLTQMLEELSTDSDSKDSALSELINNLTNSTTEKDKVLSELIENLTKDTTEKDNALSQLLHQLSENSEASDNTLSESISNLSQETHADSEAIWKAIRKLKEQTSDVNQTYEFNFGFQNGCYGYYTKEKAFKPF